MRWLLTVSSLRCMGDRLCQLTANDSLTICITLLPSQKLLFLLRTSPCFPFFRTSQSCAQSLAQYWILGLNPATQHGFKCHCLWDVMVWASGELPSCFLSSVYVTMELAQNLLPDHLKPVNLPYAYEAMCQWSWRGLTLPPEEVRCQAESLGQTAGAEYTWSHQGLCPWQSHQSKHFGSIHSRVMGQCDAQVYQFGLHCLSCTQWEAWHFRHNAINDVLNRAFSATVVPSRLEPSGLS